MFTSGHPGATQRLNTVAHLEFLRDHALPLSINAFTQIRNSLDAYMKQGPEQARQANDDFFGIENSLKSWQGQIGGLKDTATMNKKRADEKALRDRVNANAGIEGEVRRCLGQGRHGPRRAAAVQPRARVLRERPRALHAVLHARAHARALDR